jgi:hypothetical protein
MRTIGAIAWIIFLSLAVYCGLHLLGLNSALHLGTSSINTLDWVMGTLCLVWLVIVLKVPWDLYFQAQSVHFEIRRSHERNVPVIAGRQEYIVQLRHKLGWLAVGSHLASALLIAVITRYTGGQVGYLFALFYLVSTAFRPAAAGYAYLSQKLRSIATEVRYPREDIVEVRDRLKIQEDKAESLDKCVDDLLDTLNQERNEREAETREIRQNINAIGREFEMTVSRLTDNQEVIRGIQAFVRLVSQSAV